MHNFDLTAYINKNPDDNKLVIQLTFVDSMAYSQFGSQNGAYWGNGNQQPNSQHQLNSNGLTWEEQNFMDEEQKEQKPDFSEYEWMMDLEEFDEQAMKRIEQNDDLDDMFYWDPTKGVTEGKAKAKQNHAPPQQSLPQNQYANPFSSNFQKNSMQQQQPSNQKQVQQPTFNPLAQHQQAQNVMASGDGQGPSDDLSRAMGGVNLNKFHLNPDATTFVPSWLKK